MTSSYTWQERQRSLDIFWQVHNLPEKIAGRIAGINSEDMSTAEKQIAELLRRFDFMREDENGDWRETGKEKPE